jgi:hypothetical protein
VQGPDRLLTVFERRPYVVNRARTDDDDKPIIFPSEDSFRTLAALHDGRGGTQGQGVICHHQLLSSTTTSHSFRAMLTFHEDLRRNQRPDVANPLVVAAKKKQTVGKEPDGRGPEKEMEIFSTVCYSHDILEPCRSCRVVLDHVCRHDREFELDSRRSLRVLFDINHSITLISRPRSTLVSLKEGASGPADWLASSLVWPEEQL